MLFLSSRSVTSQDGLRECLLANVGKSISVFSLPGTRLLQALTVSCGLWRRYRLSGHRRHLEGPLRPVQEAQKEIGGEPRETPPAITQEELTTAGMTVQHF